MSIRDALRRALAGRTPSQEGIFSKREKRDIYRMLHDSRARDADLVVVVEEFRAALAGAGLALDPSRRQRINDFFDGIAQDGWTLPLQKGAGDWVDALRGGGAPAPDAPKIPVSDTLALRLDGRVQHGDAVVGWQDALEPLWSALWSLRAAEALPEGLADVLAAGLTVTPIPVEGDGKLDTVATMVLAAVVLQRCRWSLREDLRSRLLGRSYAQPALDAARDRALGLVPDAAAPALLAAIDAALAGELTIEMRPYPLADADARLAIQGLSFCRTAQGVASFLEAWPTFAALHAGSSRLDDDERSAMAEGLRAYIEGSTTPAFQYGKWAAQAGRTVGQLRNAELTAPLQAALSAEVPVLAGLRLTEAQASWFSDNLGLIRDRAALWRFEGGVRGANVVADDPAALCGTGFALFQRVHRVLRNRADAESDGLLSYADLSGALSEALGGLARAIDDTRAALPRFGRVTLPDAAAVGWVRTLLSERVRSDRSIHNLTEAARVWAGDADALGPEQFAAFQAFVEDYLASWPAVQVFDFNKLGRMAASAQEGDAAPLCRVNGAAVDPGRFHVAVGEAVRAGLGAVSFPQPWMANRWGYRAKQAIELIDLLAEQAWRGRGPLHTLHGQKPEGASVSIIATTSDMAYNGLVFAIRPRGSAAEWYYLDSHGDLHPHSRTPEPGHRLFEAFVDPKGRLDVAVLEALPVSPRAYPLMVPYTVGQHIDVEQYDSKSSEQQKEKERFETRYRVVRGTIVGYTNRGRYRVRLTDADGHEVERAYAASDIREMNNPHYVAEDSSEACTVRFDLDGDDLYRADLEKMTAIARAHGLLDFPLSLDEVELAARQKAFLRALNAYTSKTMRYPRTPPVDEADRYYADHLKIGTHRCGVFLRHERGVCRHMFIREHMGKQRGGLDERFASGAANTYSGDFRGLHIWGEVTLADDARLAFENPEPSDPRFLSDPTWSDPYIALWDGAYGNDQRRLEMYRRTDRYSHLLIPAADKA